MSVTLSPERAGRVTGSRVGAILGLSKYQSRDDVLREMVRQHFDAPREFTGNVATEYGTAHEEDARQAYEDYARELVLAAQEFIIHPTIEWLGCSPDGLVGDDGAVEIKCPYRSTKTLDEHPDYQAQIQLLLACTGRAWADYVQWTQDGPLYVRRVFADPDWLPSVLPELEAFHDEFERIIADPKLAAPFLADKERTDKGWAHAARVYHEKLDAAEKANAELDEAKEQLRQLANGQDAKGCGVSVTTSQRAGSVDWKKLAAKHLRDVDVEPFRKAAQVVTTIRDVRGSDAD